MIVSFFLISTPTLAHMRGKNKRPKNECIVRFLAGHWAESEVLSLLRGYCRSWCCGWADTGHVLQPGAVPGRWTTLGSGWHRWRAGGRWRRNLHREVGGWERKHELTGRSRRRGDLPASFGVLPYINDPCLINHRRVQWGQGQESILQVAMVL